LSSSIPEIFRAAIAERFHILPDNNVLSVIENQADAKCQWVKIKLKNTITCFGFSVDHPRKSGELDPIFPLFNPEELGLCSKNDAILICQKKSELYVLLVELKSENKGEYLRQLKSSEVLFRFITDRINVAKPNSIQITNENINIRGLLFRCRRTVREEITRKKGKIEYENRNGLLVAEKPCHQIYHLNQFLL